MKISFVKNAANPYPNREEEYRKYYRDLQNRFTHPEDPKEQGYPEWKSHNTTTELMVKSLLNDVIAEVRSAYNVLALDTPEPEVFDLPSDDPDQMISIVEALQERMHVAERALQEIFTRIESLKKVIDSEHPEKGKHRVPWNMEKDYPTWKSENERSNREYGHVMSPYPRDPRQRGGNYEKWPPEQRPQQ